MVTWYELLLRLTKPHSGRFRADSNLPARRIGDRRSGSGWKEHFQNLGVNRGHELERREFLKINSGFSGSGKSFLDRALGPGNWSAAHYPRASVLDCWVAQAASLTRAATCRAERRRTFVGFEAADGKSTLPLFRRAGSPCHPVQLRISGSTTTPHRKSARTLAQSKTSRSSNGSWNGGKGLPSDPAGRNIVSFALSRNNAVEMGEHDPS